MDNAGLQPKLAKFSKKILAFNPLKKAFHNFHENIAYGFTPLVNIDDAKNIAHVLQKAEYIMQRNCVNGLNFEATMKQLVYVSTLILILSISCKKKEVEVPSYVYITPFTFTATNAQGGNSFNITNGQVFVGTTFVGDYEFPITIPVNIVGDTTVSIFPSVKENGISNGRKVYKLYEPYTESVKLRRGSVDTVNQ